MLILINIISIATFIVHCLLKKKETVIRIFTIIFLFISLHSFAQVHYAVELVDKSSDRVNYYILHPEEILTQRAITRRENLKINIDALDVPIDKSLIKQCGDTGAIILSASKWLNTIYISASETQKDEIEAFEFVKTIIAVEQINTAKRKRSYPKNFSKKNGIYGESDVFTKQINTDFLHNKGFTGENIQIAILDAGFPGVNSVDPFKELIDRNGILGGYNYIDDNDNIFVLNGHGTMVLSTMAVNKPNTYLGTAYSADYWLFITEDGPTETPKEEFNWISAIEFADSVGVDVVNSSLGYYDFDLPFNSYTYDDMDGKTTFISRAASIGGQKGIIVVVSVGNEGDKTWKYIGAPADAENVISVGAVNSYGSVASFSSYGPTIDGRIKPDVSAMGVSVPLYTQYGSLTTNNGTSFSSPILAGSVACLRQAFPKATIPSIIEAMRKSADNYSTADDRTGYGIANMEGAYNILNGQLNLDNFDVTKLLISPNPVLDIIYIKGIDSKKYNYEINDALGRLVQKSNGDFKTGVSISDLKIGFYQLTISEDSNITFSFLKKN